MPPRPWTDDDDTELRRLHGEGMALHSIAKTMGRSKGTISEKADRAGLSWSRERTAAAAQAVAVDNKARRVRIIATLYTRAEEFLEQVTQPHVVFNFGGKDNTYEERRLDKPPTGDIRNLIQSASIALQRARDLESVDADDRDLPAVDAWLDHMTGDGDAG